MSMTIVTIVTSSASRDKSQETTLPNTRADQSRKVEKAAIYWELIKGVFQELIFPERQRRRDHRANQNHRANHNHRANQKALNTLRKASELAEAVANENNQWTIRQVINSSQVLAELMGKIMAGDGILRLATRQLSTRSLPSYVTSAGGAKLEEELANLNGNKNSTNDNTVDDELNLYLTNLFL